MDSKAMLDAMIDKKFKPREEVLLEEAPPSLPLLLKKKGKVRGETEVIFEKNNELHLRVRAKEGALLVLSDTYYPGWKAFVYPATNDSSHQVTPIDTNSSNRINGREEKIYRADYNFRAIPLKAGEYEVKFIYDPITFKIGALVTLCALVGILVYFVRRKWRIS
jgi:hypothetical protein